MQSPTEGGFSITILHFSLSDLAHQQLSTYLHISEAPFIMIFLLWCLMCSAVLCYRNNGSHLGICEHIICTRAAMTSGEEEIYKVILGPGFSLDILTLCGRDQAMYVHYSVSRHFPLRSLINTITQYVVTASPQLWRVTLGHISLDKCWPRCRAALGCAGLGWSLHDNSRTASHRAQNVATGRTVCTDYARTHTN